MFTLILTWLVLSCIALVLLFDILMLIGVMRKPKSLANGCKVVTLIVNIIFVILIMGKIAGQLL